jgi:flagellum-specific peptidoglycan hydrolase FlgJ
MIFWPITVVSLLARAFWPSSRSNMMPTVNINGVRIPDVVLPYTPQVIQTGSFAGRITYTKTTPEFVAAFGPMIRALEVAYGFAKGIIIGHAAVETGLNGRPGFATIGHNLFNIKAFGSPGAYWKGAVIVRPSGKYREYSSFQASVLDYIKMVSTQKNFAKAWSVRNDRQKYFTALYEGEYFEDQGAIAGFIAASNSTGALIA